MMTLKKIQDLGLKPYVHGTIDEIAKSLCFYAKRSSEMTLFNLSDSEDIGTDGGSYWVLCGKKNE